jgi:casein kinase I family protein HRR25
MPYRWCVCYICKRILLKAFSHSQLAAVESLHARHYIHRDIKPANFMIPVDDPSPVSFLIDFGLAQQFRNPATYIHTPHSTNSPIVGTLPFTSINGQQGHTQSRRDDLESLAYTIIYSARGQLPWTGLRSNKAILQKKRTITTSELCQGLPAPFCNFVTHVHSLGFEEKPDYQDLHSILSLCSETEIDQPSKVPSSVHNHAHVISDRV